MSSDPCIELLSRLVATDSVNPSLVPGAAGEGGMAAAVADYRPKRMLPGKTPSGGALERIELEPTPKVIREVRERCPHLHMVTFKYEEGLSHDQLMEIARRRVAEGYEAVVANRGEEMGPEHEQVAWLVTDDLGPIRWGSKRAIALGLVEYLERVFSSSE